MEFAKKFWRDQAGVVESSLVMVPLIALFLITVQLVVAVNFRNLDQTYAQSSAASVAISEVIPSSDRVISFSSPHSYDDLRLIVSHRTTLLPRLIASLSFFSSGRQASTVTTGVAVMEHRP